MSLTLEKITVTSDKAKLISLSHPSLDALQLCLIAEQQDHPCLVICNDSQSVQRLAREIIVFAPELNLVTLEDWETLPYDLFSPHQDIISNRLKTLYHLPKMNKGIILIPVATLIQKLAPVSFLRQHSLLINKGDNLDMLRMREHLINAGYFSVDKVIL